VGNQGRKLTKYGCTPNLTCQFSIGPLFRLPVSRRFSIAPIALIYFRIVRLLGRCRIWFFRQEQAADLQLGTKILG